MVDIKNQIRRISSQIQDTTKGNHWLFVIMLSGSRYSGTWNHAPYNEMLIALGAAFIIAGVVGVYMMLATRDVAHKLYRRFNEQNEILESHTKILKENHIETSGILKEIASSQKETSNSLKEIASSQKETSNSLKEIASSQKETASSQKETSNSLKDMTSILKRIEDKL